MRLVTPYFRVSCACVFCFFRARCCFGWYDIITDFLGDVRKKPSCDVMGNGILQLAGDLFIYLPTAQLSLIFYTVFTTQAWATLREWG